MARQVARREPAPSGAPVVFFKASTGIDDLSWNSGFHLLASWALRLKGVPVAYFACKAGMSHCVLGTNRDDPHKAPPCESCVYQSKTLYAGSSDFAKHPVRVSRSETTTPALAGGAREVVTTGVSWFDFQRDEKLSKAVADLSVPELMRFEWEGIPLGALCLPGLRWILRIHHLSDDEITRYLLREYILSAWNIARQFADFLDRTQPRAVIVFNGQFYPRSDRALRGPKARHPRDYA